MPPHRGRPRAQCSSRVLSRVRANARRGRWAHPQELSSQLIEHDTWEPAEAGGSCISSVFDLGPVTRAPWTQQVAKAQEKNQEHVRRMTREMLRAKADSARARELAARLELAKQHLVDPAPPKKYDTWRWVL